MMALENYRRYAMVAASELLYGQIVLDRLKAAKDEKEIRLIMSTARKEKIRKDEQEIVDV